MPIYEYKCENGHVFDELQKMSDDPIAECAVCGAPCERVMNKVAIHFKGSGFYTTDYGTKKTPAGAAGSEGGSSDSGSSEAGSGSGSSDSSDSSSSSDSKSSDSGSSSGSGEAAKSSSSSD